MAVEDHEEGGTVPTQQKSSWSSFLKSIATFSGDLSSLTAPSFILSPTSLCEFPSYWGEPYEEFSSISMGQTPEERMVLVLRWFIATLKGQFTRRETQTGSEKKPLNPILGESPTGCDSPLEGGNFIFKDLLTCGFLTPDATTGQGGFERHYDNCTQTPLLFNPTSKTLIAYDDPTSLTEKVNYAKSKGVAGVNVFDASGDTPSRMLLKSVNQASKL